MGMSKRKKKTIILVFLLVLSFDTTYRIRFQEEITIQNVRNKTSFENIKVPDNDLILCDIIATISRFKFKVFLADLSYINDEVKWEVKEVRNITLGIIGNITLDSVLLEHIQKELGNEVKVKTSHKAQTFCGFIVGTPQFNVYIVHFQSRGEFLWTCNAGFAADRYFGDTERAIDVFTFECCTNSHCVIDAPSTAKKFKMAHQVSRFLECNKTAQDVLFKKHPEQQHNISFVRENILPGIRYIKNELERLGKHAYIAGGTLLGWYRQCGIIQQSKDVDFAMFCDEYDDSVHRAFLGNKEMRLWLQLGDITSNIELRLVSPSYSFDLFMIHPHETKNKSLLQCLFQVYTKRYRCTYPHFTELCSVDLLGVRLLAPCDPLKIIEHEYGAYPLWQFPAKGSTWKNLEHVETFNETYLRCTFEKRYDEHGVQWYPDICKSKGK